MQVQFVLNLTLKSISYMAYTQFLIHFHGKNIQKNCKKLQRLDFMLNSDRTNLGSKLNIVSGIRKRKKLEKSLFLSFIYLTTYDEFITDIC